MKERFDLKSLKSLVADFQDFPQPGVTFRDISPVLAEPEAFTESGWFPLDDLPQPLFEAVRYALNSLGTGQYYYPAG